VRINQTLFLCLMLTTTAARADLMLDVTAPYTAVPAGPAVTITVPGFDPTLGRLDRVLFDYSIAPDILDVSSPTFVFMTFKYVFFGPAGGNLNTTDDATNGVFPDGPSDTPGIVREVIEIRPLTHPTEPLPPLGPIPLVGWTTPTVPITLRVFNIFNEPLPPFTGTTSGEFVVRYVYEPAAVPTPEPPTLVTALLGLTGIGGWWALRRRAA
jgi:hypothetical protein